MRQPFVTLTGLVVPIDRANVDTDAIIPKQFLKSISRTGFGGNLFDEWRYLDHGEPGMDCSIRSLNPQFPLNQARYRGASILLTRENFGCGSSREHAVWALSDFGVRAVIAPSFAEIFYSNCFKNGILPIRLPQECIQKLFLEVAALQGYRLVVNLPEQTITAPRGSTLRFDIGEFHKHSLLEGLDEIDLTLEHAGQIRTYEVQRRQLEPWIFEAISPSRSP